MEATGARVARDKTDRVARAWTLEMRIKISDKARHVDVGDCIFSLLVGHGHYLLAWEVVAIWYETTSSLQLTDTYEPDKLDNLVYFLYFPKTKFQLPVKGSLNVFASSPAQDR